jgi:hypothetical protein
MKKLEPGDVMFRFLPEYQVWHAGIVSRVKEKYNANYIYLLEFDDADQITETPLSTFMWGRKYCWRTNFAEELKCFGPGVFRSRKDRVKTAFELFYSHDLRYSMNMYNCEYYVRRCVFSDPKLWPSKQTEYITQSRASVWLKLSTVVIHSIVNRVRNSLEREANMRIDEDKFMIDNDGGINLISIGNNVY